MSAKELLARAAQLVENGSFTPHDDDAKASLALVLAVTGVGEAILEQTEAIKESGRGTLR